MESGVAEGGADAKHRARMNGRISAERSERICARARLGAGAALVACLTLVAACSVASPKPPAAPGTPKGAGAGEAPAVSGGAETWSERQRSLYFGIPVAVRFSPADAELERRIWAYLEQIDDVFNDYREDSEVGRINAALDAWARTGEKAAFKEFEVSEEFAEALRAAQEYFRMTSGAFDVSVGRLRRLWKGAAKAGQMPSDAEVAAGRAACGLGGVRLEGRRLRVETPGLQFDFGGCIKGQAVDHVVEMLQRAGARAALVQVGGETACFGKSPRGRPHVLGIQHPQQLDELYARLCDRGAGLCASSSGNYRAAIEVNGQVFYHIFDPRTGRPVDTRTLGVNVAFARLGRNGLADGLSTAGAVLDREPFLALVKKEGGEALVLVQEAGGIREYKTDGWDRLKVKDEESSEPAPAKR
jgi:thiamine biosynthesis lipoprotein